MALKTATKKRGTNGQFVRKGGAKKPSLAVAVDARLAALEGAIGQSTERATDASNQVKQVAATAQVENLAQMERTREVVHEAVEMVARVPQLAASAAVAEVIRLQSQGQKQLHRRVRVVVSDSAGVQMTDSTFDMSANEKLDITVSSDGIWAGSVMQDAVTPETLR